MTTKHYSLEELREMRDLYANRPYSVIRDILDQLIETMEADRWIPVSERLPDNRDIVAVITTEYDRPVTGWYAGEEKWIVSRGEFDSVGENFFSDDSITHWKPLPPVPEEILLPEGE